jgi:hypothetical protein
MGKSFITDCEQYAVEELRNNIRRETATISGEEL